ncbi:Integrase core domain [Moraxella caprae]|uniref:Integrase core domain n=2 Tax=Moraxella caprae TaxID=90240 RepID=A0A378R0C7_9GAMM|nr:IS3 family transposase [Moraxella caprae]STZ08645.1 Integrase core domain [Moraxella caprae]
MQELRHKHTLNTLLDIAKLPRSVFYYHLNKAKEPDKDLDLKEQIKHIYHTHKGRYGYRRICAELNQTLAGQGIVINHKRVQRLMKEMGLKAKIRAQRYKAYSSYQGEHQDKIKDNVLQRDFQATRPNQKWATDITEFKVTVKQGSNKHHNDNKAIEQKLYLSPIIDLFNGEIVSYAIKERPDYGLVKEMLGDALNKLSQANKDDKPIIHSDRGWHYQMFDYQQSLQKQNITQSMSRKGNCLDNAVIERLEGTLKEEIFYEQTKFASLDELKQTIDEYIHYYNYDRIKTKLKGLSPVKFKEQYRNLVLSQTT